LWQELQGKDNSEQIEVLSLFANDIYNEGRCDSNEDEFYEENACHD
jgi:hypothetical protein